MGTSADEADFNSKNQRPFLRSLESLSCSKPLGKGRTRVQGRIKEARRSFDALCAHKWARIPPLFHTLCACFQKFTRMEHANYWTWILFFKLWDLELSTGNLAGSPNVSCNCEVELQSSTTCTTPLTTGAMNSTAAGGDSELFQY
ncbi:hypothetical protein SLEP1_g53064 [Rubroshorea leprosula]|uniref:Uncharacterized protein n=1 Tax=Rubroshorea leprosula TaxID=152421 RepID=A0AAV5M8D4_9ROSI|nr:hypothetical protein SLEP1_g53064 [Rubroshorea leprosula]